MRQQPDRVESESGNLWRLVAITAAEGATAVPYPLGPDAPLAWRRDADGLFGAPCVHTEGLDGIDRDYPLGCKRTVAGVDLALRPGVRYVASRPMHGGDEEQCAGCGVLCSPDEIELGLCRDCERGQAGPPEHREPLVFVTIRALDHGADIAVRKLPLPMADALLQAFNDGAMSFDGRVW